MRFKVSVALVALVSGLTLAACGGGGSSSSSTSDTAAFCDQVKSVKAFTQSNPFAGLNPGDIEGAQKLTATFKSKIDALEPVAPDAVKSDIEKVKSFVDEFAAKVAGAKTPQDFLAIGKEFQPKAQELQAGLTGLQDYTKKTCGT